MANFDSARLKHTSKAEELKGMLGFYGYSTEADAARTDEKLRGLLSGRLSESKQSLFDIIQFVYQIQEDKSFDRIFEPMKNEIDLLGDEVKVSHIEWKDLPERFWELVIAHDLTMAEGSTNLSEVAEELKGIVSGYKEEGGDKVFDEKRISSGMKNIESLLDGIRRAFKEREAIFNLSEIDLARDFDEVRKKIEESI